MKENVFDTFEKVYLIAEIGVNHNGDIGLAKEMIDAACDSGADAVKFQTFSAKRLVTLDTPKVDYQKRTTSNSESHYQMIEKLELSYEDHFVLKEYAEIKNIDFLSTPYDIESAKFLNDELNVKYFKTASADIVDVPLHRYISSTRKPTIIAVGMASIGEIENVVDLYKEAQNENIVLLHCVSNYPCSDDSLNLNVMRTLKTVFDVPVGYSDHSVGSVAAAVSVGLGAKVIEKHFTLDKNLSGPDHFASATPNEFKELVGMIKRAEKMLGSTRKKIQAEEVAMSKTSRKSLVYSRDVFEGEQIGKNDLVLKRPGTGLGYEFLKHLTGKRLNKNRKADDLVEIGDFS